MRPKTYLDNYLVDITATLSIRMHPNDEIAQMGRTRTASLGGKMRSALKQERALPDRALMSVLSWVSVAELNVGPAPSRRSRRRLTQLRPEWRPTVLAFRLSRVRHALARAEAIGSDKLVLATGMPGAGQEIRPKWGLSERLARYDDGVNETQSSTHARPFGKYRFSRSTITAARSLVGKPETEPHARLTEEFHTLLQQSRTR